MFRPGGARTSSKVMAAIIDAHCEEHGVEPISEVPPIAPSTFYQHKALDADPLLRSARARWDEELTP